MMMVEFRMAEFEPWHDVPYHYDKGEICGPACMDDNEIFRCAACGDDLDLSPYEQEKVRRAATAWGDELYKQGEEAKEHREHKRLVKLLEELKNG